MKRSFLFLLSVILISGFSTCTMFKSGKYNSDNSLPFTKNGCHVDSVRRQADLFFAKYDKDSPVKFNVIVADNDTAIFILRTPEKAVKGGGLTYVEISKKTCRIVDIDAMQ